MQLNHERPDYAFTLRSADGRSARVNDRVLTASFILTPSQLVEDWPVRAGEPLQAEDLAPLLALDPELVVLGTGDKQVFPPRRHDGRVPDPRHRPRSDDQRRRRTHVQRTGRRGKARGGRIRFGHPMIATLPSRP